MNRFAKSLTGIKGAMVKECSSESRIYAYNFRIFQVKYWFRPLIFCRVGFEVRAGQKFVKEHTSHRLSTNHQHTLTELSAKFRLHATGVFPLTLIVIIEHFRFSISSHFTSFKSAAVYFKGK